MTPSLKIQIDELIQFLMARKPSQKESEDEKRTQDLHEKAANWVAN